MSVCFSSASVQAGGLSSSGGQGLSVLASRRGKGISHIKDGRVDWQNHLNENLAIFIKTLKWSHSWTSIFTSRIYPVETVSVYRKKKKTKNKTAFNAPGSRPCSYAGVLPHCTHFGGIKAKATAEGEGARHALLPGSWQ